MAAVQLGLIGWNLTCSEDTRAAGLAEAKAAVQLGHIGRRITSSEDTRTVGTAEAEGYHAAGAV